MELKDTVSIITGGASGIGKALCERFVDEGAAAVVVADRDEQGAAQVARALNATASNGTGANGTSAATTATTTATITSAALDVSDEAAVGQLVDKTVSEHGRIDVFVSNAGYVTQGGLEVANEEIQRMWEVHVMAHIYAARAAIPHMVANGGGYLLNTASAAGLLTQLGSMQYSVTKAAAVSLGEWLAITYGERGVRVSMLCPQAVETNILANSPDNLGGQQSARGTPGAAAGDGVLAPEVLADSVVETMRQERFLVLPHPEVHTYVERKASDIDRWLSGMQRYQSRLYAEGDSAPADWFLS